MKENVIKRVLYLGILLILGFVFITPSFAQVDSAREKDHQEIADAMTKLYKGKETRGHMKNFFECVEDRTQPVSDVASHHRTMTSCHLCNIALMLGRELTWNPEAENFGSDAQANALMTRRSRELPFPGA